MSDADASAFDYWVPLPVFHGCDWKIRYSSKDFLCHFLAGYECVVSEMSGRCVSFDQSAFNRML